jgi:phosphoacetylglucosamine mutase
MNSSQYVESCTKFLSNFQSLPKHLNYGTAGFRDKYDLLGFDCVFAKVGILACLLSRISHSHCIGIVITASHNPECDNGIKIVDKDGGI